VTSVVAKSQALGLELRGVSRPEAVLVAAV
jgi:hypothetical protein